MRKKLREILDTAIPMSWIILGLFLFLTAIWGWYSSELVLKLKRYPIEALPRSFGLTFDAVSFSAADGTKLSGWFVPAAAPSGTTLVLCHGWGANSSDILPHTVFLNKRGGYNLFYFDFRNHGESGGNRSSLGVLESLDMEAALRYLKETKPGQCRRLGAYGLSMGASVCLSVAARHPEIEAVVAESPFSSFNDVVARFARLFYGVPRVPFVQLTLFVVRTRLGFDPEPSSPIYSVDKIAPRPLFFIQGSLDKRMPPSEGERLYARAKEPKTLWTVPEADHGEAAQVARPEYEDRILNFYAEAFSK